MLLPAVQKIRTLAYRIQCTNNQKQLVLALQSLNVMHNKLPPLLGAFPNGKIGPAGVSAQYPTATNGAPYATIFFHLLPFIEQDVTWNACRSTAVDPNYLTYPGPQPYVNKNGPNNNPTLDTLHTTIKNYICPADATASSGVGQLQLGTNTVSNVGVSSYAANALVFPYPTALNLNPDLPRMASAFPDGASTTIVFTERYAQCGNYLDNPKNGPGGQSWAWWGGIPPGSPPPNMVDTAIPAFALLPTGVGVGPSMFQSQPQQAKCLNASPSSAHSAVIVVALADGSVRTVANGVSATTWWAAITPAAADQLGTDW
jgi:hypothetical protein